MINKLISRIVLITVFFFALSNNCWSQSAYVLFGNPGPGSVMTDTTQTGPCNGTGICNVQSSSTTLSVSGYAYVKIFAKNINATVNPPTCSVIIKISKHQAWNAQNSPISFFKTHTYPFTGSAPIPTNIFGANSNIFGQYGQQSFVQIPANAPNVTVKKRCRHYKIIIPNVPIIFVPNVYPLK